MKNGCGPFLASAPHSLGTGVVSRVFRQSVEPVLPSSVFVCPIQWMRESPKPSFRGLLWWDVPQVRSVFPSQNCPLILSEQEGLEGPMYTFTWRVPMYTFSEPHAVIRARVMPRGHLHSTTSPGRMPGSQPIKFEYSSHLKSLHFTGPFLINPQINPDSS